MDPDRSDEPRSPGELTIAEMKDECGYDEMDEAGGIESLIEYKNTLEERLVSMINEAAALGGAR